MLEFQLSQSDIDPVRAKEKILNTEAGGFVCFEGWVRNFNEGKEVTRLDYQAYEALAVKEGQKILGEAKAKYEIEDALCIHRTGSLQLGGIAVWIGVNAVHRGPAFDACEYIIDEVKVRVPIWKKEFYLDGDSGWVECEHCAKHGHKHHQESHKH